MVWDTRCNRKNGFFNPMKTISHAHVLPVKTGVKLSGKKRKSRRTSMYTAVSPYLNLILHQFPLNIIVIFKSYFHSLDIYNYVIW